MSDQQAVPEPGKYDPIILAAVASAKMTRAVSVFTPAARLVVIHATVFPGRTSVGYTPVVGVEIEQPTGVGEIGQDADYDCLVLCEDGDMNGVMSVHDAFAAGNTRYHIVAAPWDPAEDEIRLARQTAYVLDEAIEEGGAFLVKIHGRDVPLDPVSLAKSYLDEARHNRAMHTRISEIIARIPGLEPDPDDPMINNAWSGRRKLTEALEEYVETIREALNDGQPQRWGPIAIGYLREALAFAEGTSEPPPFEVEAEPTD